MMPLHPRTSNGRDEEKTYMEEVKGQILVYKWELAYGSARALMNDSSMSLHEATSWWKRETTLESCSCNHVSHDKPSPPC
eukprot:7983089-Alexandrium_andersonii.AAC.1